MPIYEYECKACKHRLESLQKINEEPLRDCPKCGRPDLRILISQSSFRLKGSGWYVTDFRDPRPDPGKQKKQEKDTAAGEAAASKSEGQGKSQGKEQGSDKSASGDSAKGAAPQKAGKPPKGDKAS